MRRTNTWTDAMTTQEAELDLGDGLNARIPLGRPYTIDQSAGRVIKAWDYLNKREQIIYADTGWRTHPLQPGVTTGRILLRRVGSTVTIRVVDLVPIASSRFIGASLMSGFYPADGGIAANNFVASHMIAGNDVSADWHRVDVYRYGIQWQGPSRTGSTVPGGGLSGQIVYTTDDPWPATLPGSPA